MSKFTITYGPNGVDDLPIPPTNGLHLTQRNAHGGSIGDVVILRPGESAEITMEMPEGVQITAIEMLNLELPSVDPDPPDPGDPIDSRRRNEIK